MSGNSVSAAAPGLPSATLTAARWGQLHDMLTLALDALGDSPEDFSPDFLANAVPRTAHHQWGHAARGGEGMSARKEQGPLGLVLNACDELGKVRDMLELLFAAGGRPSRRWRNMRKQYQLRGRNGTTCAGRRASPAARCPGRIVRG